MVSSTRPSNGAEAGSERSPGELESEGDFWAPLREHLFELREYAVYYLSLRADQVKYRVRRLILRLALACLAAVAGVTITVTACAVLVVGCGQALGEAFGGRTWLGYIIVGAIVLVGCGLLAMIASRAITHSSRHQTKEKYAQRRQQQRHRFQHDVSSRAGS